MMGDIFPCVFLFSTFFVVNMYSLLQSDNKTFFYGGALTGELAAPHQLCLHGRWLGSSATKPSLAGEGAGTWPLVSPAP